MDDEEEGPRKNPCPFCKKGELKDGRCACGAWSDSLGLLHRGGCAGGYHEACDEPKPVKARKAGV